MRGEHVLRLPRDRSAPRLEAFHAHPEANTYTRLIVALLERGRPMTLAEVANRFEEAGVADFLSTLLSLQRCKPARLPIVRDGDASQRVCSASS